MDVTLPLDEMTVAEKLCVMEALWEDLTRRDEWESPAWHLEVLRERRRQTEVGEAVYNDWEEAKERLFRRLHESQNP